MNNNNTYSDEFLTSLVQKLDLHNAVFPFDKTAFDYEPSAGDIFLLSYPKCGSNWLQHMFWSMLNDGVALPAGQNVNRTCPWLEYVGKEGTESVSPPRLIKSHLALDYLKQSPDAKYIYLTRNPKDTVVSFWHHFLGLGHAEQYYGDFDKFVDRFITGDIRWGSYYEHLLSILKYAERPNVIIMKYEEMKRDTKGALRRVAEFAGVPKSPVSDELLDNVLKNTNLNSMQENQDRFYPKELPWVRNDFSFIRQGAKKGWAKYLSKEQSDKLDAKFYETFKGTKVEDWWQEEMAWHD